MIAFPDTSFLCALYRRQDNSPVAAASGLLIPWNWADTIPGTTNGGILRVTRSCPTRNRV